MLCILAICLQIPFGDCILKEYCMCLWTSTLTLTIECSGIDIVLGNGSLFEQLCGSGELEFEPVDLDVDFSLSFLSAGFDPPEGLFAGYKLRRLMLNSNRLKRISPAALDGVVGIDQLNIDWNQLSSLEWLYETDNFNEVTLLSVESNKLTSLKGKRSAVIITAG